MSNVRRVVRHALLVGSAALMVAAPTASAAESFRATPGAVYVLSNDPGGNAVVEFARTAGGSFALVGSHPTGGLGTGGGLGSQGAVVVDDEGRHVYAVNAGSNSVSSLRVTPAGLELVDTVASGGTRPTSLDVHGGLLYVLNAGGHGNIAGFTVDSGDLSPIEGSTRPLTSASAAPAQVSFTVDGRQLIVAERATNRFGIYAVDKRGLATGPAIAASSGTTPFGFDFDNVGHVIVSEAFGGALDASAVSSYDVLQGDLAVLSASVPTTETAACWIAVTGNGRFAYAGNAGSSSVTGYAIAPSGRLTVLDADGKTGSAAADVTDLAVSRNSSFLYGRLANGSVAAWSIGADGALSPLGHVAGLPSGAAGIAAT